MTEGSGRSYRVLERLGVGAFGAVYLAEAEGSGLSKRVAIKVPHADRMNAGLVARLRDEARLLSLIRHRSIVRVDDLLELDGAWSVVMEYVEGCDVAELITDGPIPPKPALAIAEEVAQALHAAYHQNAPDGTPLRLLHRDIKPSNLRITTSGEVKILDFGVARADFEAREANPTQSVFGTSTYLAPERYHGEDSRAGDVYALGVTLFEMLTGVPPGKSAMDADRQPPGRKWAEQWAWLARVHPDLSRLVASMLAMEPKDRPSARECARALTEIRGALGGHSIEDWAERVIPPRVHGAHRVNDDRTGSILIERSTSKQRPTSARPWWAFAVAGLGLMALFVGIVALGLAWRAGSGDGQRSAASPAVPPVQSPMPVVPDAVAEAPSEAAPPPDAGSAAVSDPMDILTSPPSSSEALTPPTAVPDPAAAVGTSALPSTTTAAPATTTVAPAASTTTAPAASTSGTSAASRSTLSSGTSAAPQGAPAVVAVPTAPVIAAPSTSPSAAAAASSTSSTTTSSPPAAVPPPPAGMARLTVTGDAQHVRVTSAGGDVRAGNVRPGTYSVDATLPSGEHVLVQDLTLKAGQVITVRCSARLRSCKPG